MQALNSSSYSLLLLEPEGQILPVLKPIAQKKGWELIGVSDHYQLFSILKTQRFDFLLLEQQVSGGNSLLHLPEIRELSPDSYIAIIEDANAESKNLPKEFTSTELGLGLVDQRVSEKRVRQGFEGLLNDALHARKHHIRPQHILVIDDSRVIRKICMKTLFEVGFRVSEARTSEEALGRFDLEHVDIVITDIFMPGIGGIAGIAQFKALYPEIIMIAMSGGGGDIGAEKTLKAAKIQGAEAVLTKPFSPEELLFQVNLMARKKYLAA